MKNKPSLILLFIALLASAIVQSQNVGIGTNSPHNSALLDVQSSNKGVSFTLAGTPGRTTANHPWEATLIRTVPGFEGHVWVPLASNGLKYSTDHGVTYTTIANVTYCKSIGIGKAMPAANYPTVFIWGTVSGVTGLFRSTDQGATWLRMNDDANEFAGAPFLIGDMNVAGRLYMSAGGGRGIIYWYDVNTKPEPEPETVTSINDEGQGLLMYPNPTTSIITIPNAGTLRSVTLLDERGKRLSSIHIQGDNAIVSLKDLPAGIYLIELVDQQGSTTIRRAVKK